MKDLYSYTSSEEKHKKFYDQAIEAYHKIFNRLGIGDITYLTLADGGAFTKFSHEFQTICEAGEDVIFLDKKKKIAVNKEIMQDDVLAQQGLKREDLEEVKTAEVGNIFSFGGKKSEELGLTFTDVDGSIKPVILGSYGIGITRLLGVVTELLADEKGLVWPEAIAPAKVHIVRIGAESDVVTKADELYNKLQEAGVEAIYDDRELQPGEMLADADLLGIPKRIVISSKSIANGGVEVKSRTSSDSEIFTVEKLLASL